MIDPLPGTWMRKDTIKMCRAYPKYFSIKSPAKLPDDIANILLNDQKCPLNERHIHRFLRWWTKQPQYVNSKIQVAA